MTPKNRFEGQFKCYSLGGTKIVLGALNFVFPLAMVENRIIRLYTYVVILVAGHEVLGDVDGQDVRQQLLVVRLQIINLF